MTSIPSRPESGPAAGDISPLVELDKLISCGAGTSATFEVFVTHRGPSTANLRITVLGLDGRWVPPPLPVGPIEPGETTRITLSLVPERGALGARYPFVVAAEATPISGRGAPVMGVAESTLAVDSRDPISMTLTPQSAVAVFSQRVKVQITNPGRHDRELSLSASAARGASMSLSSNMVTVPAGRTITVSGRVRVTHPRFIGHQSTHTFAVAARGQGAPEFMEGTLRSKPVMGGRITGLLIAALVIVIWAGAAIVGIPKLSSYFSNKSTQAAESTTQLAPGAADATSGGAAAGSGSAGAAAGSSSGAGSGSGGSGSGSGGSGGASGSSSGSASEGQLSGTVTGTTPKGVQVSLEPTSLVEASAAGGQPAAGATDAATASALRSISAGAIGKVPAEAVRVAPTASDSGIRTTKSAADGSFSFAGISSPGYYLLTLAKPGFATQRFVINAATLDAATPIKVALVPGNGSLSGNVSSAAGPVGAASVKITDGTVALQTSTVSSTTAGGKPGSWTVNGLSTPGTYLITVNATGYGAASSLVKLAAGGTGKADLALETGVAAINGKVSGVDNLGHLGGLGGVTVTASGTSKGVKASRTATTVTSGPVGTFALPDLPTPGAYTVTVSGAGYASQTRQVSLAEGSSSATVNVSLTQADGTVSGTVVGDGKEGGLIGAGLTLTGSQVSYKTMTTSAPAGSYRFTGVPPGTYVLQASQYGRRPSSATVVVTAANSVIANLHLVGAPDTELPDTSHIRGRAVDARTQGPLTCDRSATPVKPANCLVTATTLVPLNPSKGTAGGTETITALSDQAGNYTLPSVGDKKHPGLVAGLYQVTLSGPGYEPTTISVQVAQGQTVPAPQVSLSPLGLITGTITARVGTPVSPSCVVSVPAAARIPTTCTPTSATACTVPNSPSARCSMTAADGSYEIRGLVHGGYQVVVLPTDKEYLSTQPLAVQLDLGADFRYDATLDRLGRATITVLQSNPLNLALTPAKGAAIQIVDAQGIGHGNPLPGDSTSNDGVLTMTGLLGSFTALASGQISTTVDPDALVYGTASAPTGVIALNQTVAVTMVLSAPIGAVVGHVTVAVDGTTQDVANAVVQVTGVVGFNGRISVSGTVSVTTDSNGCYAIIPASWSGKFPLSSADCPTTVIGKSVVTITDGSGHAQSLVALPLSVNVAAVGLKTQSYSATGVVITGTGAVRVIPPINLLAQPVTFPALSLDLTAPPTIRTDAHSANIVVLSKPAGAGNITVTAETDGTLTWTDSNLGTGRAIPGTYTLRATQLGFYTPPKLPSLQDDPTQMASGYATLWCGLGVPCRFGTSTHEAPAWTMSQLPSITGTIAVPKDSLPLGVNLSQAIVSVQAKPSTAGAISVKVDQNTGAITYVDSSLPDGLAQPTLPGPAYQFTLTLPGYAPESIKINCGTTWDAGPCVKDPVAPLGEGPFSATLTPLPRFRGSITTTSTLTSTSTIRPTIPNNDFSGITVSFDAQPNPANPVTMTVNSDGTLAWNDPNQPANVISFGNYHLTFSKPGYQSVPVAFSCPAGSLTCPFSDVNLNMFPLGAGTVSVGSLLPGQTSVNWAAATVTVTSAPAGTSGLKITVSADTADPKTGHFIWVDSGLPYPGITTPGNYVLTVSVPGYGISEPSPSVTCNAGGSCNPIVGQLKSFPQAGGSVSIQAQLPGNAAGFDWTKNATVTLSTQAPGSSQLSLKLVQDSSNPLTASLNWSDPSLPAAGITWPGTYRVVVSIPGYSMDPATNAAFTCSVGDTACGPDIKLIPLPVVGGSVTVTATNGTTPTLDGITVAINPQPNPSNPVVVTVDPATGNIHWTDPTQPADVVTAGTYNLTFTKPGYAPVSKQLICVSGATTCDIGTIALLMDPHGTGSVSVSALAPGTTTVDWTKATVTLVNQPPNTSGLRVSLVPDELDPLKANFSWVDSALPFAGITLPGPYAIRVALPGYGTSPNPSFTCKAGDTTCGPDLLLTQQPTFSGTVATNPADGSLTGAVVSVTSPAGVNAVTTTVAADGTIGWQEAGAPAGLVSVGTYQITATLAGYISPTVPPWVCTAASCPPLTIVFTSPSTLQLTVSSSADGAAPINGAMFDLSGTGLSPSTVNGPTTSNVVSFPSLSPLGDYQVTVHAAGYRNQTFDSGTKIICTNGDQQTDTGLLVMPGGTTKCAVTLNPLGSITLQTTGVASDGNNSVSLGSVPVTVQQLSGTTPTGPVFSGTTSATGALVITGTNANQGLLNGTWRVTASQNGYATKVGTVVIAPTTYAMTADTGSTALPIVAGVLQVRLTVNPVALQVHLTVNGVEALPAVTVSLAGGPTPLACTIKQTGTTYACAETSNTGTVVNGAGATGKYVNFAAVSPSIYTVSVTSSTSTYRTVTLQAQIVAGIDPQQLVLSLDERSSSQGGTMTLADGTHPAGMIATLRPPQNISKIANDQDGQPLTATTDANGRYQFTGIPDGPYTLVGEYPGYAFGQITGIQENSANLPQPPVDIANLQLTTRALVPVTLNLTTTAKQATGGSGVLSGASVVLEPLDPAIAGLPADAQQTFPVPSGTGPKYAVVLPQLPTGKWGISIVTQSRAPFGGVVSPDTITVPTAAVTPGAIPVSTFPLLISQSLVALQVTFQNNTCLTPAPTSLDLTLTQVGTTGTQTVTAPVVAGATSSTATAQIYLPEGNYSFIPTVDPALFTATAKSFPVSTPDPSNSVVTPSPTVALTPKLAPLAVSMTVDGLVSKAAGFVFSANDGTTKTTSTVGSDGTAPPICLKPSVRYDVSVDAGTTGQQLAVPPTSVTMDPDAPNTRSFKAFTVTPSVALEAVTGRVDPSTVDVPVDISSDGKSIYSNTAADVSQSTPASAPPIVIGDCSTCNFTLTATPPVGGVFGAVTGQAFTPSNSLVLTATLPYTAAMATVLVARGGSPVAGAVVTVAPQDKTAPVTDSAGETTFQDLTAATATKYVFTADWFDTSVTPSVHYRSTSTSKSLDAGANTVTMPAPVVVTP